MYIKQRRQTKQRKQKTIRQSFTILLFLCSFLSTLLFFPKSQVFAYGVVVRTVSNKELIIALEEAKEQKAMIIKAAQESANIKRGIEIAETACDRIGPRGSVDCSLFVQQVMAANGIKVPRTTFAYLSENAGQKINEEDMRAGDIILYDSKSSGTATHVGIYVGDGDVCHVNTVQGKIEQTPWRLANGRYPIVSIRRFP